MSSIHYSRSDDEQNDFPSVAESLSPWRGCFHAKSQQVRLPASASAAGTSGCGRGTRSRCPPFLRESDARRESSPAALLDSGFWTGRREPARPEDGRKALGAAACVQDGVFQALEEGPDFPTLVLSGCVSWVLSPWGSIACPTRMGKSTETSLGFIPSVNTYWAPVVCAELWEGHRGQGWGRTWGTCSTDRAVDTEHSGVQPTVLVSGQARPASVCSSGRWDRAVLCLSQLVDSTRSPCT